MDEGGKKEATKLTDQLTLYIVLGSILGARIVEILFYEWHYYKDHLVEIFNIRQGGLASHGGVFGVIIAVTLFYCLNCSRYKKTLNILAILDAASIGGALTGSLIRIGNFINQEIVGTVTDLPWAIIFMHPQDYLAPLPRHPVQLYESIFYFCVFIFLLYLFKNTRSSLFEGSLLGWFLVLTFGFRIFIEQFKVDPGSLISTSVFTTGQILSIPIVLFGAYLLFRSYRKSKADGLISH
jgi:prolipoprotein diacylglyceryl transferase